MLDQHLVHGGAADVRIERRFAQFIERLKGRDKALVVGVGGFDDMDQTSRQLRHLLVELLQCLIVGFKDGFSVGIESGQQVR